MKLIRAIILIFTIVSVTSVWAQSGEIEEFDLRLYNPKKFNLKDLVFEARISNLKQILEEKKIFGELVDIYYKVHWIFPGEYRVTIEGLPKGFKELKSELISLILTRLDFVIPEDFSSRFRAYSFKKESTNSGVRLLGEDKSHTRAIDRVQLDFDKRNLLQKFYTFSPAGTTSTTFNFDTKRWSQNKWVLQSMETSSTAGNVNSKTAMNFDYESIAGIGLPSEIKITMTQSLILPDEVKDRPKPQEVEYSINFSKYEVNTGKAATYIMNSK